MSNRLPFTFDESFKISLNAKEEVKKKTPKWSLCGCCSCECGGQKVKNFKILEGAISFQRCSLLRCSVDIYQEKKENIPPFRNPKWSVTILLKKCLRKSALSGQQTNKVAAIMCGTPSARTGYFISSDHSEQYLLSLSAAWGCLQAVSLLLHESLL